MNYFMFNKALDYARGRLEHCEYGEQGLTLSAGADRGYFLSRVLDGEDKNLIWNRLEMASESLSDACIQVRIYASQTGTVLWDGEEKMVSDLMADRQISTERLLEALAPWEVKRAVHPEDILLHDVKGRYLWILAELFRQGDESPRIRSMKFEFPKESWISYLPRIYQEDQESGEFLERYLEIFKTIYEEAQERIRNSHRMLDTEGCGEEFLQMLAGWLDADSVYLWSEEKLRALLGRAMELYGRRGTRQGLIDLVTLYTGVQPYLVEPFQTAELMNQGQKGKSLERLYGREDCRFYLLIPEEAIPTAKEYQAVMRLIRDMAPAHMEAVVVPLKPYLLLGSYSYLGVNSRLGRYRALRLDGLSLLSFTAVGERQGEER